MAVYNHLENVGKIVRELYKIPNLKTTVLENNIQISADASLRMEARIGPANYAIYVDLIEEIIAQPDSQEYFDTMNAKEYMFQSSKEKVITSCHRAEAHLYTYFLIDKLRKLQNNNVSFDRQSTSGNAISPTKLSELEEKKEEIMEKAFDILDSVSFDIDNPEIVGSNTMVILGTKNCDTVYGDCDEEENDG